VGDRLTLVESSRQIPTVLAAQEVAKRDGHGVPSWLKVEGFDAVVLIDAPREDIQIPVREQLVVELYSK
jgi:ribosomal protein S4